MREIETLDFDLNCETEVEDFIASFGDTKWLILHHSKQLDSYIKTIHCCLSSNKIVDELSDTDLNNVSLACLKTTIYKDDDRCKYSPYGNNAGYEPIVFYRDNYRKLPDQDYTVNSEFLILFNLFYDDADKSYVKFLPDNSVEEVIKEINGDVCVSKKYLLLYAGAKKKRILLYVEIANTDKEPVLKKAYKSDCYNFNFSGAFLSFQGKKLLTPPTLRKTYNLLYPGNDQDDSFININGLTIKRSESQNFKYKYCNVLFHKEVLEKFFDKTISYKVENLKIHFLLRNISLTYDYFDEDTISFTLNDLWNINIDEREYMRKFNVARDKNLKKNIIPIDEQFKKLFFEFNDWYCSIYEKPFFDLADDKKQIFYTIRSLFFNNQNSYFATHVINLSIALIDSMNHKVLPQKDSDGKSLNGSINKLQELLKSKFISNYEDHIQFLHALKSLRNNKTHNKIDDYNKNLRDISGKSLKAKFNTILQNSYEFIYFLTKNIYDLCS